MIALILGVLNMDASKYDKKMIALGKFGLKWRTDEKMERLLRDDMYIGVVVSYVFVVFL
jgi:hypothetical protein